MMGKHSTITNGGKLENRQMFYNGMSRPKKLDSNLAMNGKTQKTPG
jgi:hypothetical protein